MKLSKEQIKAYREEFQAVITDLRDYHEIHSARMAIDLIDTIESQQQKIEQLQKDLLIKREAVAGIGRLCAHYRQEIEQKDKALRLARTALRDYCSIIQELALVEIEKALGGKDNG